MRAQVLDVGDLEPYAGNFLERPRNMRQLPTGEDGALDELAAPGRAFDPPLGVACGNAVIKHRTAGF